MVDDKPHGVDDDDGSTGSSTRSDDTHEAFLEMLGLPAAFDGISAAADDDDDENDARRGDGAARTSTGRPTPPPVGGGCAVAPLEVPPRCSRHLHHPSDVAAFVINDFLDASECRHLIELAETLSGAGFRYVTEAAHTDDEGITHVVELREKNKHKLSVFEHGPTTDELWRRMEPVLLPRVGSFVESADCGPPLGLNPRLRVLRYDASDDDVFEPHFDATTRVGGTTSLLTVLIYLNDGGGKEFGGGETCYMDSGVSGRGGADATATRVAPAAGKVAVFEHDLFHASAPLTHGTKYVLRTDVLFGTDAQADGGVARPRRGGASLRGSNDAGEGEGAECATLLEVCRRASLPEADRAALDGAGMLDLTLDALFAPGAAAVRQMVRDVLPDEPRAERLVRMALDCR